MELSDAIAALAALAQATRLDTFRLLVRHEPEGLPAGERVIYYRTLTDYHRLRALVDTDPKPHVAVVGGGIIGLEMATVFRALGSQVTVVEFMDQLMPGADKDLVKPLADRLKKQGIEVHLKTKASGVTAEARISAPAAKATTANSCGFAPK